MLTLWQLEFTEAMDYSQREGLFTSVSSGSMADRLGVVIHGFDNAVVDSNIKVGEDPFFMTSEHPGKISEGLESTMSGPPEPSLQVLGSPASSLVAPKSPEQLFEEVSPYNLEIAFKQIRESELLVVCKIPGVFQPDILCSFKGTGSGLSQRIGLHFANFINGFDEMANDVELVKHDHSITATLMNDIDVVLPHVTAHTLNGGRAFFAPPLKESPKRIFIPVGSTPYEPFPLQIIYICVVGMPFFPADLINANEPDRLVILSLSAILYRGFHCCPDRVPGDIEKPGNLIPWQHPRPESQDCDQGKTDRLFPHAPGNSFHPDPMFRAHHSPGPVTKKDGNAPEGNMSPDPLFESVLGTETLATDAAGQLPPLLGVKFDPQFIMKKFNGNDTMILDSESKTYDTFDKHESTSVSGILGNTLTNGFGSCFQVLSPLF